MNIFKQTHIKCRIILMLLICLLVNTKASYAQVTVKNTKGQITPGGYFDNVVDRFGNKYTLADIAINEGPKAKTTSPTCDPGYFKVYYEAGSGFADGEPDYLAHRAVLCQVLSDISGFINSPLTGSGHKVNIWVRNIASLGVAAGGFAGVASSFYNVPNVTTISGIADNTVWTTINSGIDAYTNVTPPVMSVGGIYSEGSIYFHGMIAFDFSSFNWNTDLTSPPMVAGQYDLYTTALHEMTHALGFASMIDYDGTSRMGAGYNYYTRYDQHLFQGGNSLIKNPTGCSMYNWVFNSAISPATSVLSPGSTGGTGSCPGWFAPPGSTTDHTVCISAVKYIGSTTQTVYNPSCYEKGSSLSHFEDECLPGSHPFVTGHPGLAPNNQYFLMANRSVVGPYNPATNPGAMKRYPTPEERQVLCDIGYNVGTTFGNTANLNFINYGGSPCSGINVVGVNDGINLTTGFTFSASPSGTIGINNALACAGTSILDNDYGISGGSFECLEVVTGGGSVSASSGSAGTAVTYTAGAGDYGVQLLRYVPVSAGLVRGNITYIYVWVSDGICIASPCDLVPNGGFEQYDPAALPFSPAALHCWATLAGDVDLWRHIATAFTWYMILPTTGLCTVPDDVHAPVSIPAPVNNNFVAMQRGEALETVLTSPLISGTTYKVSFWAKMADIYGTFPTHVQFAVCNGIYPTTGPFTALPSYLAPLCEFTVSYTGPYSATYPSDGWVQYSTNVTYTGPTVNTLAVIHAGYDDAFSGTSYLQVDDISVEPITAMPVFTPPTPITTCGPGTLPIDLSGYVDIPGGTFAWQTLDGSGALVTTSSPMFDPIAAYNASLLTSTPGLVNVCYTHVDALGCSKTVCANIQITSAGFTITGPAGNVCPGTTVYLSCAGSASYGYNWNPTVTCLTTNCDHVSVSPMVTTTYTVIETTTGCIKTITVESHVVPEPVVKCYSYQDPVTYAWHVGFVNVAGTPGVSVDYTAATLDFSPSGTYTPNPTVPGAVLPRPLAAGVNLINLTDLVAPYPSATLFIPTAPIFPSSFIISLHLTTIYQDGCQWNDGCYTVSLRTPIGVGPGVSVPGSLSVIPNPNNGAFTLSGILPDAVNGSDVKIEVVDMLGKTIYKGATTVANGIIYKNINLEEYPNGVYTIRVKNDNQNQVLQFTMDR